MKGRRFPIKNEIPDFWISAPMSGAPIQIPEKEDAFFVPLKTPLPEDYQTFLNSNQKWTLDMMIEHLNKNIKSEKPKAFVHIETEITNSSLEFFEQQGIYRIALPIEEYKQSTVDDFIGAVSNILKDKSFAQFNTYLLISCFDATNKAGFLICSYLMRESRKGLKEAFSMFENSIKPGIFRKEEFEQLCLINGVNAKESSVEIPSVPAWAEPNPSIGIMADAQIQLEKPSFEYFNGEEMKNPDAIGALQQLVDRSINSNFTKYTIFPTYANRRVWKDSMYEEFDKSLYRITLVPRGTQVFMLSNNQKYVFLNYGNKKFWRFEAEIKCDLPFVATATIVQSSDKMKLYVTDLLLLGNHSFENDDIDVRMSALWYSLLPKINPLKNTDLRIFFRPVGRVTDAVRLYDECKDFIKKYGFFVDGLALLKHGDSPGKSIYIPHMQSLLLYFKMSTYDQAILYARSDTEDNLVPVKIINIKEHLRDGAFDGHVIRFAVRKRGELDPIGICKSEYPDNYAFVRAILDFYIVDQLNPNAIVTEWQSRAKARSASKPPAKPK